MTMRLRMLNLWVTGLALVAVLAGCSKEPTVEGGTPKRPYPLDRCLVSDDRLGEEQDGEAFVYVHDGQEIRFCSENCLKEFKKNPRLYLGKLPPVAAQPPPVP